VPESVEQSAGSGVGLRRADSVFIIPTLNRPRELRSAVHTVLDQTVLPGEICIVDASEQAPARPEIIRLCAERSLSLDYVHPAPRGLTLQRNMGVDRTEGDPVFFLDDDVRLAPDCHEQILNEFSRHGPEVGGIAPTPMIPPRSQGRVSRGWHRAFGLGGCTRNNHARMKPGFWCENVCNPTEVVEVQCMRGLCMAFRRKVFDDERFDEALAGYAFKEDVDFTYRVSRRFTLLQTPLATCDHLEAQTGRLPTHRLMRLALGNHLYLHRKNMPQDLKHRAALWWGLLGLFIWLMGRAVVERQPGLVTGFLAGAWDRVLRRGLLDAEAFGRPGRRASQL
jgi:GT2 family glycosyltransferase